MQFEKWNDIKIISGQKLILSESLDCVYYRLSFYNLAATSKHWVWQVNYGKPELTIKWISGWKCGAVEMLFLTLGSWWELKFCIRIVTAYSYDMMSFCHMPICQSVRHKRQFTICLFAICLFAMCQFAIVSLPNGKRARLS